MFANSEDTYYLLGMRRRAMDFQPLVQLKQETDFVVNVGSLAAGTKAAVCSTVRFGITEGHKMFGVNDGFEGFYKGQIQEMKWGRCRWLGGPGGLPASNS